MQDYAENMQETTLNGAYVIMVKHDIIINNLKFQIGQHHVEELVEMIEMDTWITQFGVQGLSMDQRTHKSVQH